MTHPVDPQIKLSDALEIYEDNQAALAKDLIIVRSVVSNWIAKELEFVPPIHAYRLIKLHPKIPRVWPKNK